MTSAARKPRVLHPDLGAAKREPLGSTTAGLLPAIAVRHMGDENPLVVSLWGQEEQEEQEVQEL